MTARERWRTALGWAGYAACFVSVVAAYFAVLVIVGAG